jgi:tetratricopeptide (TPR) repeat protein
MRPTRRHCGISILCLVALACGHVEPAPQANDSKQAIVLDDEYFESHPKSQSAWLIYGLARVAMPDKGEYRIEVEGRQKMIDYWKEEGSVGADAYLDFLVEIEGLGFLEEYVIAAFGDPGWTVPGASMADLDIPSFVDWAEDNLQGHTGEVRAFLERPRLETPGALYPSSESFIGTKGLRCDKIDELEGVLEQWAADRKTLAGRALAAPDGMSFLFALDGLGTGGVLSRTGATLVPPLIAELNFIGGFCAVERGDWKTAQRHFEGAISLISSDSSARLELAYVRTQLGEFESAEEQIEFVLTNSQDPCAIARALRSRGFIQFERGALIDAYATYTKSLDYEPGSQLARSELRAIYQTMESQGFTELPSPEYVPPPTQQLTTRCTL